MFHALPPRVRETTKRTGKVTYRPKSNCTGNVVILRKYLCNICKYKGQCDEDYSVKDVNVRCWLQLLETDGRALVDHASSKAPYDVLDTEVRSPNRFERKELVNPFQGDSGDQRSVC